MADLRAVAGAETHRVEVRRLIARPLAEVFEAWTNPRAIEQWFTNEESEQVRVEADPRIGGRFRIDLVHQGKPWRQDGRYLEIVPGRRVKFTWVTADCPTELSSTVTVDFHAKGDSTELVLVHVGFPNEKARADHDFGWKEIVAKV